MTDVTCSQRGGRVGAGCCMYTWFRMKTDKDPGFCVRVCSFWCLVQSLPPFSCPRRDFDKRKQRCLHSEPPLETCIIRVSVLFFRQVFPCAVAWDAGRSMPGCTPHTQYICRLYVRTYGSQRHVGACWSKAGNGGLLVLPLQVYVHRLRCEYSRGGFLPLFFSLPRGVLLLVSSLL